MIPSNSKSWQYNASHGILRTATRRSAFGPRKPDTSRALHSRFKLQVPPKSVQSILVWNSQSWQYNASRAWPQHSLASMDHVHLSVAQLDLISSPRVGSSPFCPRARALLPAGAPCLRWGWLRQRRHHGWQPRAGAWKDTATQISRASACSAGARQRT